MFRWFQANWTVGSQTIGPGQLGPVPNWKVGPDWKVGPWGPAVRGPICLEPGGRDPLFSTVYGYLPFNNIEMFSFSVLMLSTSLLHFWRVVELPNWVISYWL